MTAEPTLVHLDRHIFSVGELSWTQGPLQPVTGPVCLVFEPRDQETFVTTGISSGNVKVWGEAITSRPSMIAEGWEDIAEVSLTVRSGPLQVMGIGGTTGPEVRLDACGPGDYRLRIHAKGRDTDYDAARLDAVEDYLILAWPEQPSPPTALRTTSHTGEMELNR